MNRYEAVALRDAIEEALDNLNDALEKAHEAGFEVEIETDFARASSQSRSYFLQRFKVDPAALDPEGN